MFISKKKYQQTLNTYYSEGYELGYMHREQQEPKKPKYRTSTKVMVISYDNTVNFNDIVNNFIKDKKVIDIKFKVFYDNAGNVNYRAFIMYEVTEEVKYV